MRSFNVLSEGQAAADDEQASSSESDEEEEEEHIIVTRPDEERDPEIDAEFDREFQKMMAESMDSRKSERRPMFDVPLPMRARVQPRPEPAGTVAEDSGNEALPLQNTMKFSLLSKKGNKPQVRVYSRSHVAALMMLTIDSFDRPPVRLQLCSGHAYPARSRKG